MQNSISSPFPLYQYTESEANPSWSKKGKAIAAGRTVTRLKLGDDSRFFIAAKVINRNSSWLDHFTTFLGKAFGRYTEIKNGDDKVYINVGSLAQRLHVKRDTILQASKKGELLSLLNQQAQRAKSTIFGYEKIVNKFGDAAKTGHSPKALMKVIRTAVLTEQPDYSKLEIKGNPHTYHLGFDKNNKEIELAFLDGVFAEGLLGEIREFKNVLENTTEVFKQARADQNEAAREDIENEYHQLNAIHAHGKVWGVQAPPRKIVQIQENASTNQFGYIGMKYDGDYFDEIGKQSVSFKDRLFEIHQLLFGLKELAVREMIHGDIKSENIFIKKESDGTKLVHIADLGGAKVALPTTPLDQLAALSRAFSPAYSPLSEIALADDLAIEGKFAELVELEKKRDVFSMGTLLYQVFTNSFPYELSTGTHNFPILTSKYEPIDRADVPKEIKDLIENMVHPVYTDRPTAQEAFQIFDRCLQAHYPEVRLQIQEKIQKEYPGSKAP